MSDPGADDGAASGVLRVLVCGSALDGKSRLIGRLLYEREPDDAGRAPSEIFRHLSIGGRDYIVAEPPNVHLEALELVRATTCDAALILIDARRGLTADSKGYARLVHLLRIPAVAAVVTRIDEIDYSEPRYREVERAVEALRASVGLDDATCIPVSALASDNIRRRSDKTPWFTGPTLFAYLERLRAKQIGGRAPFRMPVRWAQRTGTTSCVLGGTIVSGAIGEGDAIVVAAGGQTGRVERVVPSNNDPKSTESVERASAGQAVTLELAGELDVRRGDVIAERDRPPQVADVFQATIVWMHDQPMLRGRSYAMRIGTAGVTATIAPLKYKLNLETHEHVAATTLELGEIGVCNLELSQRISFDPYEQNRETGSFVLVDRITNDTVGEGLIQFDLRRAHNLRWQQLTVDRRARAEALNQKPRVIWLTGLSGAGKSTIANHVEAELHKRGEHTYLLDGDNVRHGLNRDLGFTDADRVENIRRVAEVASLMVDAGLIVLVSFISPFRSERQMARELFQEGEFIEVFVDTPLEVAEARDPKGLYKKARHGELTNFTGISSPYEPPSDPEVRIDTIALQPDAAARLVISFLDSNR